MKHLLKLSYNGTRYHGWQKQINANTVQDCLEDSLTRLLGRSVETIGCGRTDTGVHAKCYYAHFDCDTPLPSSFKQSLNAMLPVDIAIQEQYTVPEEFHARFSATEREYKYYMHFEKDPFLNDLSLYQKRVPKIESMNKASKILFNYNDFECFSKKGADNQTFRCEIRKAEWTNENSQMVFTIRADRFLRNMVRAIVGTLLEIGYGKMEIVDLHTIIKAGKRQNAGTSVQACGLYLTDVLYDGIDLGGDSRET
ncbi:MAG: tRNA pseudouridine(38-40) synthase TruA [Flavobacteriales bacterium]|nr:tRNA pseudouridine(38-40) synthase TruA [Flavobacteriales bacterium]